MHTHSTLACLATAAMKLQKLFPQQCHTVQTKHNLHDSSNGHNKTAEIFPCFAQLLLKKISLKTSFSKENSEHQLQVWQLSFTVIHSTTLTLLAQQIICTQLRLKSHLISCDIITWWNSTYDMMKFALEYQKPINTIITNKELKLRKYELDNNNWRIVEDLVLVLEVRLLFPI